jgi:hypothetical protein
MFLFNNLPASTTTKKAALTVVGVYTVGAVVHAACAYLYYKHCNVTIFHRLLFGDSLLCSTMNAYQQTYADLVRASFVRHVSFK